MLENLPYFALFYTLGILAFAIFFRFWMRSKKIKDYEEQYAKMEEKKQVDEEMAKKIKENARRHRRDVEDL